MAFQMPMDKPSHRIEQSQAHQILVSNYSKETVPDPQTPPGLTCQFLAFFYCFTVF